MLPLHLYPAALQMAAFWVSSEIVLIFVILYLLRQRLSEPSHVKPAALHSFSLSAFVAPLTRSKAVVVRGVSHFVVHVQPAASHFS